MRPRHTPLALLALRLCPALALRLYPALAPRLRPALALRVRPALALALGLCIAVLHPAPAVAGPAPRASTPAAGPKPTRRALPDSVLLRIDGREDVTRRRFVRAVQLLGGEPDSLTPADRDRFLDMVIEQRLLTARAVRDPRPWARAESLTFAGERDHILLRAALSDRFEEIERRRRAQGQPDLDENGMGVAARESLMLEIRPQWDTELLRLVGSYFAELPVPTPQMTAREQLDLSALNPKVPASDTAKVLVRTTVGSLTVADMLADWRRLSSLYRPRVRDDESVKALVENSLFERAIRLAASDPALPRRPVVAAAIADRIEYHAVSTFLQRELLASIPTDSATLLRHFRANRSAFDRLPSASLVILTLASEHAADSLARLFTVAGEAESLAFRAQRSGVRYTLMVSEASDSLLFRDVMRTGAGGVSKPHRVDGGWRVYKVLSIEPRASREFAEVHDQVLRSWNEEESERRIRALLESLKQQAKIERNEPVLRALAIRRTTTRGS